MRNVSDELLGGFTPILDERIILALFAIIGLFLGLILVGIRRKPHQDVITGVGQAEEKETARWDQPVTPVSSGVVIVALLLGGVLPGALMSLYFGPVLGVPLGVIGAWLLPTTLINNARSRWVREMDDDALSLLQLLILKLQSGQSLLPALDDLVRNSLSGPLAHDVQTFIVGPVAGGANITQVLSQLRDSPRYQDTWRLRSIFRHLATATRAQMPAHKIAERLQTLQQALVDTYALQLELQADLAQAKYSRWIVSGTLPVVVIAFNSFAPDIGANLFNTVPGQIAIVFAVVMVVLLNVVGAQIAKMPPLEL